MSKKAVSGMMLILLFIGMLTFAFNIHLVKTQTEGALLFFDDFDDGVADGWTEQIGDWEVIDGEYYSNDPVLDPNPDGVITTVDNLNLSDFIISVDFRIGTEQAGFRQGLVFRYTDPYHYYRAGVSDEYDCAGMSKFTPDDHWHGEPINGTEYYTIPISPGTTYSLKLIVSGNNFSLYLDGESILTGSDDQYTTGLVGLKVQGSDCYFDNFTVYSIPKTICVDDDNTSGPWDGTPEHPYQNITSGLEHALAGDTIYVYNGTYYENVVVNRTILLIGENRDTTIIKGNRTETGILVTADHVTIQGVGVQKYEVGIKVEGNNNVVSSNRVSLNGYNETELLLNQEIYQDYVSPTHRWYLHNMINGNYTAFFNITNHTPAISVQALGQEDVNQLGIGLFNDVNNDNEPQLHEYVGYMDAKEQNVHVFLVNPPVGQYIIKVLGWEVLGEPGHFDLKITTYRGYGIMFLSSRNNTITENLVKHNPVGLYLYNSHNSTIRSNKAIENVGGIVLSNSTECVISNNNASSNEFGSGLYQFGIGMTFWSVHDFYISENKISSNMFGIWLLNSSYNEVIGNDLVSNLGWGLLMYTTHDNTVQYNNILTNNDGIRMMFSRQNNFTENHFESNGHAGIFLWLDNDNNSITRNKFYSNGQHGVELKFSDNNTIADNKVAFNGRNGILIIESTGCTVRENIVSSSPGGIIVYDAFGNTIYHNGVIDDWEQPAWDGTGGNFWDNGYPDGGNYWSDYEDVDQYSGPYQNETGSDGIWDHPCGVGVNNQDNYPLTKPIPPSSHDIGVTSVATSKTVVGQGFDLCINVKTFNYGNNTETFNVTAYYNDTAIILPDGKNHTTTTLTSHNSTTLTIPWNTTTTPKGNYTIKAHITPLLTETDTTDNTHTNGWIIVTWLGDLDGDFDVDEDDLWGFCAAFIEYYKGEAWDPNCDFDCNCIIDEDDLWTMCAAFIEYYKAK